MGLCVKDPNVTSVSPSYGPKDGGTLITLTGTQLDAGLNQQVFVNSLNCPIIRCVNNNLSFCRVLLYNVYSFYLSNFKRILGLYIPFLVLFNTTFSQSSMMS